jgi:hypothetical protein
MTFDLGPLSPEQARDFAVRLSTLASLIKFRDPGRVMILLEYEAKLLSRPCHADIEKPSRLTKAGRAALVPIVWQIANVHAVHHDGIKLPTFRTVQSA